MYDNINKGLILRYAKSIRLSPKAVRPAGGRGCGPQLTINMTFNVTMYISVQHNMRYVR